VKVSVGFDLEDNMFLQVFYLNTFMFLHDSCKLQLFESLRFCMSVLKTS
jgi:hypothetical protein